jgi:soluble lytic murein transglycosylase
MRRAPKTLSRLNAASLIAALLVFGIVPCTEAMAKPPSPGQDPGKFPLLSAPGASGQDSVAYAVPRNAPSPDVEIVLPQNLPPSAVTQYQRIMQLQASGDYTGADQVIARLSDTSLLGPVLAARYLSPDYRSTSAQLVSWCQA